MYYIYIYIYKTSCIDYYTVSLLYSHFVQCTVYSLLARNRAMSFNNIASKTDGIQLLK